MAIKEWVFPNIGRKKTMEYAREWDVPYILAALFYSRGFKTKQEVDIFLDNNEETIDPFLFDDMDKLVERLNRAIENFEKICVYGDYDADGITSTVLMYSYLKDRGANVMYHIPSRYFEGYGLNEPILNNLKELNVELIVTVDNGISAHKEIEIAASLGIEVVVTDHHMPREIPPAFAVVDPHRNKKLGFTDYAGVGVVFKVIEAMEKNNFSREELIEKYGDLVAIGTIGDVVPLLGENRLLVLKGLEVMKRTQRPGTRVLVEGYIGKAKVFDSLYVSYNIVPKINSCGRTGSPEMAAKLFFAENYEEAVTINEFLIKENENRKVVCENVFNEVEKIIKNNKDVRHQPMIFAQNENWNRGVLGIVASKVMVKYGKPSVLFSIEGDEVRGSARSILGFSMFDAVLYSAEYIDRFGGHPMAAGMNLKKQNLPKLQKSLLEFCNLKEMPNSCLNIDCIININEINTENIDRINKLKPFGAGNLEPVFGILGVKLINFFSISDGKYLKISFSKNNEIFYAMYFGVNKDNFFYSVGDLLDLAVCLRNNYYMGSKNVTISIKEIKYASLDTKETMRQKRIFENFMVGAAQDKMNLIEMGPTREDIAMVYKVLKKYFVGVTSIDAILKKVTEFDISLSKLYIILEILNELEIAEIKSDANKYNISVKSLSKKLDIEKSKYLIDIKSKVH